MLYISYYKYIYYIFYIRIYISHINYRFRPFCSSDTDCAATIRPEQEDSGPPPPLWQSAVFTWWTPTTIPPDTTGASVRLYKSEVSFYTEKSPSKKTVGLNSIRLVALSRIMFSN